MEKQRLIIAKKESGGGRGLVVAAEQVTSNMKRC